MQRKLTWWFALLVFGAACGLILQLVGRHHNAAQIRQLSLDALRGDANSAAALENLGRHAFPVLAAQAQYRSSPPEKAVQQHALRLPHTIGKVVGMIGGLPNEVEIREAAARAFGSGTYPAEDAIPILIHLLGESEGNIRWEAARSLATFRAEAVGPVTDLLAEPSVLGRAMAAYVLGEIGPEAAPAIPALLVALTDPEESVAIQAAAAVPKLGPRAVVALAEIQRQGTKEEQRAAKQVLDRMVTSPAAPLFQLKLLAADPNPTNRALAMSGYAALRPNSAAAFRALTNGLFDPHELVRIGAAKGLALFGPRASNAIAELEWCLKDQEPAVCIAASNTLQSLRRATAEPSPTPP